MQKQCLLLRPHYQNRHHYKHSLPKKDAECIENIAPLLSLKSTSHQESSLRLTVRQVQYRTHLKSMCAFLELLLDVLRLDYKYQWLDCTTGLTFIFQRRTKGKKNNLLNVLNYCEYVYSIVQFHHHRKFRNLLLMFNR